jgi:lipoprotein-anchoring transpeptidase ErfK/SrfK
MRAARSSGWTTLAVCAALLIAGCGGGHSGSPSGGDSPAAIPPLRVVSVSPATLTGTSPIVVTFRRPLTDSSAYPTLTPNVAGQWSRSGATATFTPSVSYPPSTAITMDLVRKPGAAPKTIASRTSADGSMRFAQQILARLHYLPLTTAAAAPVGATAEAAAVYQAPRGKFGWRFSNTPSTIQKDWKVGQPSTVMRAAVIAFQHQHHLVQDGAIGPATWKDLQRADLSSQPDPDKYSYVTANLYLPQKLSVWVDGATTLTSPVNGGVNGAPTPLGTYPIYQRYASTTMQGTNPDGSKYKDPGVPWVNYFSGGSAVHGFPRASYGFPQSVGCLELPIDTAARVYKMIDYGTLVTVTGPFVPKTVATPAPPRTPKPKSSKSAKPSSSATPSASSSPGHADTPAATKSHQPTH